MWLCLAPAQDSVEYMVKKFTRGLGEDIPIYEQPPSPEVDNAWGSLYEFAMSKIHKEELNSIVNKTWPVFEDPDFYFVALDVFHQLHCLDMLRQAIHPTHYVNFHLPPTHLRHCIGAIRQSLMCFSDVSPIVWQWSEEKKKAVQRDDILHTCRKFENVQEWAKNHHYNGTPNFILHI
ncbi:hypothetical protein BDQ17DRAFT_1392111 [Cyathus striatus]|nr:hypothetical protein BDQ17DRAFT_1392111 [Cyathus striatus]